MKKVVTYGIIVLLILLIFSGFSTVGLKSLYALTKVSVSVSPNTVSAHNVELKIDMTIGPNGLNRFKYIYIQFPTDYPMPTSIGLNSVKIGGNPVNDVRINGNVIALQLGSYSYSPKAPHVIVEFYPSAGISNPSEPGTYEFFVWTDDESLHQESFVTIGGSNNTGSTVMDLTVFVSPSDAGKVADYVVNFRVSVNGALMASNKDYVDIYFPKGTTLPPESGIDPTDVYVNDAPCSNVKIGENSIRVYIPNTTITQLIDDSCKIKFTMDFGIKNPGVPGAYSLQVATSKDTGLAMSNIYYIVGTAISNVSVAVHPSSQSTVAEYKVVFTTSASGSLLKDKDKINIIFPKEVVMPSNIISGAISVNNTPCTSVVESDHNLSIVVPINVPASGEVTVIISQNFGLKNPSVTGEYDISVYTSADRAPIKANFAITTSTISNVSVQLSTTSAGAVCQYTISFVTGASGALSGGIDKINIIFPVGTTVPDTIPNNAITVNGIPTTNVMVNGTTVTVTVPKSAPENYTITVIISDKAGIKNPVTAGTYRLYVNTTKETSSVESSPYTIYVVPKTQIQAIPSEPNGGNGYYTVQPVVSFTATSPVDPNPMVYYYFDNNPSVLFTGQAVKVPEGIHTLYYYAVDHQNHKEKIQSVVFKVDTVPPQIVVLSPQNGAVLNSKTVVVKGKVDKGCAVTVSGETADVASDGDFTATVQLSSDSATLIIVAKDLAGNTSQTKLSVSVDTTPPSLTVTTPIPFQEVHKLPLVVKGKTEKGAIVTVNDNTATVDQSGNFTYALNDLSEKEFTMITVIAKDAAGNETEKIINVKYVKTTIMKLQINNKVALVNSTAMQLDAPPIIRNNRTLVPLRFISEAFGVKPEWDPVFKIIDIPLGDSKIRLQVGAKFMGINNKKFLLDVAPAIINGRTMVPIRFISQAFDALVQWDPNTKTITVIYPKPKP